MMDLTANPLCLPGQTSLSDPTECYFRALVMLYKNFPCGYMEMTAVVAILYGEQWKERAKYKKNFKQEPPIQLDWRTKEAQQQCKNILYQLQVHFGISAPFDYQAFNQAFTLLRDRI